ERHARPPLRAIAADEVIRRAAERLGGGKLGLRSAADQPHPQRRTRRGRDVVSETEDGLARRDGDRMAGPTAQEPDAAVALLSLEGQRQGPERASCDRTRLCAERVQG